MKKKRWLWISILMMILLLSNSLTAFADIYVEPINVRVGFFSLDGYHMVSDDGIRSGYGYELLQEINVYTDWTYEYIGYEKSWSDALKMLDDGEVDLLTSAQMTDERLEKYDFSEVSVGSSSTILTIKAGNTKFISGEYDTYEGMRVGMVQGNSRNDSFDELAGLKGFSYEPVYYESFSQMQQALSSGKEIDAIVTSNLRRLNQEWVLDTFDTSPFYVIVKKGNEELISQVDYALKQMDANDSGWRSQLWERYYNEQQDVSLQFSSNEMTFLQELSSEKTKLKVIASPDRSPYSHYDGGAMKGIVPDVFDAIAKNCGIDYEIIEPENRTQYKELIESGDVDIVLDAPADYTWAENNHYVLTDSYMTTTISRITRKNWDGSVQTVAVRPQLNEKSAYAIDLIFSKECIEYEDFDECIDAVRTGKVDATYVHTYSATEVLSQDYKNELQVTMVPEYSVDFVFGVNKNIDHRLMAILNKGVKNLSNGEIQNIIMERTVQTEKDVSIQSLFYTYPVVIIIGVIVVIGLIFVSILLYMHILNEKKEETQKAILKDALETARQASQAKGTFLSRVSHEIRTPLNAVIGYMSMVKSADGDMDKIMHCVNNSETAAKHLLSIINDVLDMSSIESGKMKIAREDFDLKQQITSMTAIFFNQTKEKGIHFEVKINALTQEWVVGDKLRLNQVLMNLLSNAVKFTPSGGTIIFSVTQMHMEDDKVFIKFVISDTGIGMSDVYKEHIFTAFEQESAKTAQQFGGTGLGLAITKNLLTMMGGNIDVESEQGKGSTFTVTIQFGVSEENKAAPHESAPKTYGNLRALVVDDLKNDCDYIKDLLKRCGVKSDIALGGEAAIKQIKRRRGTEYAYDLCIMDWNMPGIDGIETARRIKAECQNDLPIIIATAYDTSEFEEEARKIGVMKVIAKPLFQSTVFDLLVTGFGKYEVNGGLEEEQELQLDGMHVLLAEDNAMNMEIAVDVLTKAGIIVEQAHDGQEAVDVFMACEKGTYDLILMDVQMPRLNGYEATVYIRRSKHPEARTIPIIAMTANAFAEDVTEAMSHGMNDHISKPIDQNKLFKVMKKYYEHKESGTNNE